jgi:peptidoglycan/LPS O-acetylase OafA/YrhL
MRETETNRLKTIDGLRGLAALAVVIYHLDLAARLSYGRWTPEWVSALLHEGFLGVDIFFVLSGFVIAYSVRSGVYTPRYLGSFVIRRSIRLDPPYWVAIFLESGLVWLSLRLGASGGTLPRPGQVLAHFLYLQNLLGLGDIVPVFWTLCYEIQFYVFLIALLVAGHALRKRLSSAAFGWTAVVALGAVFILSLLERYGVLGFTVHPGVALGRWCQFFLGTLVWWVVSRGISRYYLLAAWAIYLGAVVFTGHGPLHVLPIAVSALLWWSYERDRMASIFGARPWQFLGAISYSLYLFHAPIGWRLIRAPGMLLGISPGPLGVLGIYLASVLGSIAFAWMIWRVCERPFIELSKAISLPKRAELVVEADGSAPSGERVTG